MPKPEYWYRQSAVIPYRLISQASSEAWAVEILLITSRKRKRWVIPKGIVDPGLSARESALKEAYEEAGIRGNARDAVLGTYCYKKWQSVCRVDVFLLEVTDMLPTWPEAGERNREWLSVDEAVRRVQESDLQQLLRNVPNALAQEHP